MQKSSGSKASGRFVLRLTPGLHAALRGAAADASLSLNDYCARKLAVPAGNLTAFAGAAAVVERATELFGQALIGVVAFGSWARGEALRRMVHGQPYWSAGA